MTKLSQQNNPSAQQDILSLDLPVAHAVASANGSEEQTVQESDDNIALPDAQSFRAERQRKQSRAVQAAIRSLLLFVTSQYVVVVLLVLGVGLFVSRQASQIINQKFLAITQALKIRS